MIAAMLLAIETSSRMGSIALVEGGEVRAERSFAHGLQNAARVLPLIDDACRAVAIRPHQITQVAVSIGPGSFTGLRIGVTLAKTLCYATGAKLIAVPTLPVMAVNAPEEARYIMPIIDAKRDQVFAAVYEAKPGGEASHEGRTLDEVIPLQLVHLPDLLASAPRPLLILGEGVQYHQQHLFDDQPSPEIANRKSKLGDVVVAPESLWYPKASTVAHLAEQLAEQGAFADPFTLAPRYIRKPEAQERMEAGLLKHLEG